MYSTELSRTTRFHNTMSTISSDCGRLCSCCCIHSFDEYSTNTGLPSRRAKNYDSRAQLRQKACALSLPAMRLLQDALRGISIGQRFRPRDLLLILLNRFCHFVDRRLFSQLLNAPVGPHVPQSQFDCDLSIHSDHCCEFCFREHQDLQPKMPSLIGAPAEPCLPHEDEACKQDALQCQAAAQ